VTSPYDPDSRPLVPGHEVTVHDGRFSTAECSCGWRSAARRHRATARQEARDHVLLYADGSRLAIGPAPAAPDAATPERADAGS
jgi:hypothetical protein